MNIVKARVYFKTRHSGDDPDLSGEDSRISFRIRRFWMRSLRSLTRMTFEGGLRSGQSLVEVLVSLSIATLVLSAITVGVVYSLRNAQFSKNQNLASQYASQGMEIIRQIRDNKSTLLGYDGDYCLGQDSQTPEPKTITCPQDVGPKEIGPTPSSVYIYKREVNIEPPDPMLAPECGEAYKVTVKVLWWDNVCGDSSNFCHKVNLASCLSDRPNTLQL